MRQINLKGFKLITQFEGCRLTAYTDSVGIWTIGYGHIQNVTSGQKISQEEADSLLESDLTHFEDGVQKLLKVDLNDNQFGALVSFAYNVGLGNLAKSHLLKYINEARFEVAAGEFLKWDTAGGRVIDGLERRRQAEHDLFIS